MSHFTVTVRLSDARMNDAGGDVNTALATILAPFDENTEERRFQEFNDTEDEYAKEFETGLNDMVRMPSGDLVSAYDGRFYQGDVFSRKRVIPADCAEVSVPHKTLYSSFDEFATKYHGAKRDPENNRYGYWRSKQAKWDWYQIGGRWTGFYPLLANATRIVGRPGLMTDPAKQGRGDAARLRDIDMSAVAAEQTRDVEAFFAQYTAWLVKPTHGFESPRSRAMDLGLCRVVQGPVESPAPNEIVVPWAGFVRADDSRCTWNDVLTRIERSEFIARYLHHFNPISTYAALDDDGWHEPGKMGWWACSSAKPDDYDAFRRGFVERFLSGHDDLLVVVDCHI